MKIVKITWEDIQSSLVWNDEFDDVEPPVFETVGFLKEIADNKVVIYDTNPGYGNVCVFPKGAVIDIEYLT